MNKRRLSISNKLILMITVSSVISLLLAIGTISYFNILNIKKRAIENISVLGEVIAERSTAALAFMDARQSERNLLALRHMKHIVTACLYNNDYLVVAQYINPQYKNGAAQTCPRQILSDLSHGVYKADNMIWGKKIFLDNSVVGYIYIKADDSFVYNEFYEGISRYLIIILVVISFSLVVANRVQKIVSRPIIELELTARIIAANKDYSIRAEKISDDELGDFIDAFNSMLEQTENNEKTLLIQKQQLESHQQHLEMMVKQRTSKLQELNNELKETLTQVEEMQEQLIESEKMASLGALVAGIAHEVNTPIGICLTAASFLKERYDILLSLYNKDAMTQEAFEEFLKIVKESAEIMLKNIQRATDVIQNFKKVAVDQSVEDKRCFNVKDYLYEIIKSLQPRLKKHKHIINIQAPEQLSIMSYPGSFYQIFSNLILNSLIHGFSAMEQGVIDIKISYDKHRLAIVYTDNGKGMTEDVLMKVFEPFATTMRNRGGTGLGAHIIYNIITQQLQGKINCESHLNNGVRFDINIPVVLCEGES